MKYETPELLVLMPALRAAKSVSGSLPKIRNELVETPFLLNEPLSSYEDWE